MVGALLALVGVALPWVTVGQTFSQPFSVNGFSGFGILVFVACVLLLGVLTLPYASKTGRSGLDRAAVYLMLTALAVAGLVLQAYSYFSSGTLGFPDTAPGL